MGPTQRRLIDVCTAVQQATPCIIDMIQPGSLFKLSFKNSATTTSYSKQAVALRIRKLSYSSVRDNIKLPVP